MRPKTIILICAGAINALLIYRYFSTLVTEGNRSANGFGALFLILFLALFNAILFVIFFVKKIALIRAGLVIAFLPIAIAFVTSLINGNSCKVSKGEEHASGVKAKFNYLQSSYAYVLIHFSSLFR